MISLIVIHLNLLEHFLDKSHSPNPNHLLSSDLLWGRYIPKQKTMASVVFHFDCQKTGKRIKESSYLDVRVFPSDDMCFGCCFFLVQVLRFIFPYETPGGLIFTPQTVMVSTVVIDCRIVTSGGSRLCTASDMISITSPQSNCWTWYSDRAWWKNDGSKNNPILLLTFKKLNPAVNVDISHSENDPCWLLANFPRCFAVPHPSETPTQLAEGS